MTARGRAANPVIEVRNIDFGYRGHDLLFNGLNALFWPATMVAITGASGRGKSTLLYLLGLMLTPNAGQILIDGEPVHGLSDTLKARWRANEYGFIFQDAALDPKRTILDNVIEGALYRGQDRQQAREAALALLDRFGVSARVEHRPGEVSGGQAQRIALCRAIVGSPRIILADEPTGNLDPDSAKIVMGELAAQARRGATVIVVTHSMEIADACDERLVL